MMEENNKIGLILTLGFSPEPLTFAINDHKANNVCFIGTKSSIEKSLDDIIEKTNLRPSQYRCYEIEDSSEKIGGLVADIQKAYLWLSGSNIKKENIIVDATGGKKWMSSGATIVASFLGLKMIYVDAKYKEGKPDLQSMKIVPLGNAYDQSGFMIAEQGRVAFNNSSFEEAANYFSQIRPSTSSRSDFFHGLAKLSSTLGQWDRFEHYEKNISSSFEEALVLLNRAVKSVESSPEIASFLEDLERLKDEIKFLEGKQEVTKGFVFDLFFNAKRRLVVGRYDDCVARLYRTLEATSQFIFKSEYGFETASPDYSKFKSEAIDEFKKYLKKEELPEKLDLKNSFILLYFDGNVLANEIVKKTKNNLRFTLEGILSQRNSSILAHGFKPIPKEKADSFVDKMRALLKLFFDDDNVLEGNFIVPPMPKLGL